MTTPVIAIIAVASTVLMIIGLVVRCFWWHATYCPDGTKHQWEYDTWVGIYYPPESGVIIGPAHHTAVTYYYKCSKCGRERYRCKAYFGCLYKPTREDWEEK